MSLQLTPETKDLLERYLRREVSNDELDDWITGSAYDEDLPQEERDALAGIQLTIIEVGERSRPNNTIRKAVKGHLSHSTALPISLLLLAAYTV
jgi:hypothetical protein